MIKMLLVSSLAVNFIMASFYLTRFLVGKLEDSVEDWQDDIEDL